MPRKSARAIQPPDAQTIGELIGTVAGLANAFKDMQQSQSSGRQEIMNIFQGIRNDNEKFLTALNTHIREEADAHQKVAELATWKDNAKPQVESMWDSRNVQRGAFGFGRLVVSGLITFAVAIATVVADRMFGRG